MQDAAGQEPGGGWAWTSGDALDFLNWATGQPNNNTDQDCASLNATVVGGWNDVECAMALPFACERL